MCAFRGGIDFPIYTGGQRERTHYALGRGTPFDLKARVIKITPRTNLQVEIAAINDDDRIFSDMPRRISSYPPRLNGGGRGEATPQAERQAALNQNRPYPGRPATACAAGLFVKERCQRVYVFG